MGNAYEEGIKLILEQVRQGQHQIADLVDDAGAEEDQQTHHRPVKKDYQAADQGFPAAGRFYRNSPQGKLYDGGHAEADDEGQQNGQDIAV